MDQHSKSELIAGYRKRYNRSSKKEKSRIISSIIEATGYCRKYVIQALNAQAKIPKKITRSRPLALRSPLQASQAHLDSVQLPVRQAAQTIPAGTDKEPQAPQRNKADQR